MPFTKSCFDNYHILTELFETIRIMLYDVANMYLGIIGISVLVCRMRYDSEKCRVIYSLSLFPVVVCYQYTVKGLIM